ncbi:phosphohydrolase [Natrialba sp. INN-245]|uniref:phosphohydrolase n=1 Tax=Natrialba sp. INN-245 TaxID=2690967 RepID=UPI00130F7C29|nr:phosphohydrolase [Natrialba sp. INN-245]MWV40487.1 phosphohydrolase [Natrialba sp. INN-245]
MANEQSSSAITTYSGVRFDPLEPAPDRIRFEDVAHGLSQTCRFSGQSAFFYTVGTHSLYVSDELAGEYGPRVQLYGLLHDAAEAYITDLPRPVKRRVDEFGAIEDRVLEATWERLGVRPPTDAEWTAVMDADDRLFRYEATSLLNGFQPAEPATLAYDLEPCVPSEVRRRFLERVEYLRDELE